MEIINSNTSSFVGKLYRRQQGAKFIYYTISEDGLSRIMRTSARDYIACTDCGSFFFSRLDLIGGGDHGRTVRRQLQEGKTPAKILYLREIDKQTAGAVKFADSIARLSGAVKGAAEALGAVNNSILKIRKEMR